MGRNKQRNPYDVLGVSNDADDDAIKRAYRQRVKHAHPDTGGTSEEFAEIQSAYVILSDHQKRSRYDRDGTVDDENPENKFSASIGICIAALMHEAGAIVSRGGDPTTQDLFALVRNHITRQIGDFETKKKACEDTVAKLRALAKRIKVKKKKGQSEPVNFLKRAVEEQANHTAESLDGIEFNLDNHRAALALLADHEFEQVVQEQLSVGPYVTWDVARIFDRY